MTARANDLVPLSQSQWLPWWQRIARATNNALQGKLNATNTVTLTASVASTTLTDSRLSAFSFVKLMPQTSNAAAEQWWISGRQRGQCVINHANNAQVDRTFIYMVIG